VTDVIVVGAGLTGVCTAAELARSGLDVLLLGQGVPGDGLPPLAWLPTGVGPHADVWRRCGGDFLLDRDPVPVLRAGAEVRLGTRVDPLALLGAWISECARLGVTLRLATPVLGLVRFGGGVTAVRTVAGTFAASTTVLAAGLRTSRLLAGTPGDVVLGISTRRWWLLGRGVDGPADALVDLGDGDWLAKDAAGRTYVERGAGRELGIGGAAVLDEGTLRLTTTPDGEPIVGPPAWTSGAVVACSGDRGAAAMLEVADAVVAGIRSGAWDGPLRATRGL
jgi:glycine/D-amino acid oxidase-like deaminating enzyme